MTPEQRELAELYRRLGPMVYRRCVRLLGDADLAQDATQEVFLKLGRGRRALRSAEAEVHWAYRAATHHCLNVLRGQSRRATQEATLALGERVVSDAFPERQLSQQVLARFDRTTQAVAVGVLVDEMEHEELAATLGISRRTVARKLERFLDGARKFIARST